MVHSADYGHTTEVLKLMCFLFDLMEFLIPPCLQLWGQMCWGCFILLQVVRDVSSERTPQSEQWWRSECTAGSPHGFPSSAVCCEESSIGCQDRRRGRSLSCWRSCGNRSACRNYAAGRSLYYCYKRLISRVIFTPLPSSSLTLLVPEDVWAWFKDGSTHLRPDTRSQPLHQIFYSNGRYLSRELWHLQANPLASGVCCSRPEPQSSSCPLH